MRWTSLISLLNTCRWMNKCDNVQPSFHSHHTACARFYLEISHNYTCRRSEVSQTPHDQQTSRRTGIHCNLTFYSYSEIDGPGQCTTLTTSSYRNKNYNLKLIPANYSPLHCYDYDTRDSAETILSAGVYAPNKQAWRAEVSGDVFACTRRIRREQIASTKAVIPFDRTLLQQIYAIHEQVQNTCTDIKTQIFMFNFILTWYSFLNVWANSSIVSPIPATVFLVSFTLSA